MNKSTKGSYGKNNYKEQIKVFKEENITLQLKKDIIETYKLRCDDILENLNEYFPDLNNLEGFAQYIVNRGLYWQYLETDKRRKNEKKDILDLYNFYKKEGYPINQLALVNFNKNGKFLG